MFKKCIIEYPKYIIYRDNEPIMTLYNYEVAIEFCAESTMSTGIHYWVKENI